MNYLPNTPDEATAEPTLWKNERAKSLMERIPLLLASGNYKHALVLFNALHPTDQGEVLTTLSLERQQAILWGLPVRHTARILEHMEPEEAAQLVEGIQVSTLSDVLDLTPPDVAADILKQLPEDQSREILRTMAESEDVISLLGYPDETAGGLMTIEFPVVRDEITAANALDLLRIRGPMVENAGSLIIVDQSRRLVGTLSVVHLALARPATLISEIMDKEVLFVPADTDQEECARLMERYNLNHLPVVDGSQKLLGVILGEDLVDVLQEEATEDMYRISGMGGERLLGPLRNSVRRRLQWLYLNLATTLLAALVISFFEATIVKLVILAAFLPVVGGQGGIGGTQTLTLVVRSMALGEIFGDRGRRILIRELYLGLIHGILLGIVVGLLAFVWLGNPKLGLVLAMAMLGNMLIAGLTGAAIPLVLRRLKMDPAVSSAVFVTTVTDIFGFLLFLGVAAILIEWLL